MDPVFSFSAQSSSQNSRSGEIPDHKQMEKQKKSCQTPGSTPGQGLNYPLILEAVYEFRPREVRRAKVLGGPEIAGPWTVWPGVSQ